VRSLTASAILRGLTPLRLFAFVVALLALSVAVKLTVLERRISRLEVIIDGVFSGGNKIDAPKPRSQAPGFDVAQSEVLINPISCRRNSNGALTVTGPAQAWRDATAALNVDCEGRATLCCQHGVCWRSPLRYVCRAEDARR
jgi:hypothetical protein